MSFYFYVIYGVVAVFGQLESIKIIIETNSMCSTELNIITWKIL